MSTRWSLLFESHLGRWIVTLQTNRMSTSGTAEHAGNTGGDSGNEYPSCCHERVGEPLLGADRAEGALLAKIDDGQ